MKKIPGLKKAIDALLGITKPPEPSALPAVDLAGDFPDGVHFPMRTRMWVVPSQPGVVLLEFPELRPAEKVY